MAWQPINDTEISTGEPVSNEVHSKIKNNLELLESRTSALEGGNNTVYPPIVMAVNGEYGEAGSLVIPASGILKTTMNFNLTITGVRVLIDHAGVSGTTEIDLKFKAAGGGSYDSIFVTRPSVSFTAGDDAISTNAVLDLSKTALSAGGILRLDITNAQVRGKNLVVRIDYSKT